MKEIQYIISEHNFDRWEMAKTIYRLGEKLKRVEAERHGTEMG